jgi:hypothetical protein
VDPVLPTVEVRAEKASSPANAGRKYVFADYLFQLVTTTAGVLIALLASGLVDWSGDRALVREARSTIAREIAGNQRELQLIVDQLDDRAKHLTDALDLVEDLTASGKPASGSLNIGFNLASLRSTAWRSAERTGALALMDYSEVQRYSELYDYQDLFIEHQRQSIGQVSAALALVPAIVKPAGPNPSDLTEFKRHLLQLKASLFIEEQLGASLLKAYNDRGRQ